MIEEVMFAYIAGIIDGEGSIGIQQSNKYKPNHIPDHNLNLVVTVVSTDKPLIEWLKETLGGNTVYRRPRKENHKEAFSWHIYGTPASNLLKKISPYLIIKKKHATLGVEFQSYKKVPRKPTECERQWAIKNEMHQLSRKGPKAKLDKP